jgi:methionyl-tRNA formyltransferase
MNIIFFGTSEWAVPFLYTLNNSLHKIVCVITTPDKKKGRGKVISPPPVKETAQVLNIPVVQPENLKTPLFLENIKKYNAQIGIVVSYGKFIPEQLTKIFPHKIMNVHPSLLPLYRGPAPMNWAIINGDKLAGMTITEVSNKMDAGDILMQWAVKIDEKDNYILLSEKLSNIGRKMLLCCLENIKYGRISTKKQREELTTYAPPLKKEDGRLNFEESASTIARKIRGMNPKPGTFTFLNGKRLKILKASPILLKEKDYGKIIKIDKDAFYISCKDGALKVEQVQMEGKKIMDSSSFLRGFPLKQGTVIGLK